MPCNTVTAMDALASGNASAAATRVPPGTASNFRGSRLARPAGSQSFLLPPRTASALNTRCPSTSAPSTRTAPKCTATTMHCQLLLRGRPSRNFLQLRSLRPRAVAFRPPPLHHGAQERLTKSYWAGLNDLSQNGLESKWLEPKWLRCWDLLSLMLYCKLGSSVWKPQLQVGNWRPGWWSLWRGSQAKQRIAPTA